MEYVGKYTNTKSLFPAELHECSHKFGVFVTRLTTSSSHAFSDVLFPIAISKIYQFFSHQTSPKPPTNVLLSLHVSATCYIFHIVLFCILSDVLLPITSLKPYQFSFPLQISQKSPKTAVPITCPNNVLRLALNVFHGDLFFIHSVTVYCFQLRLPSKSFSVISFQ